MKRIATAALSALITPLVCVPLQAQDSRSAEEVVREVYDMVSWTDGNNPDWNDVRPVFMPEAVIVLRYPQGLTVFSLDGFFEDWVRFEKQLETAGAKGFQETVVSAEASEFGDIAHVWVLYESSIPDSGRGPRPGVDSWSLIRIDGEWRVASVVNELPRDDLPIPESLRN